MGSFGRKLARKAARNGHAPAVNPLAALQGLQEAAKAAGQLQEVVEHAQRLVSELQVAREALFEATAHIEGLQYELDKQRAVFLRFFYSSDCITMGPEGIDNLLRNEQRFRAEYDAIEALKFLASSVQEGS